MDAIKLLVEDHKAVENLFLDYEETEDANTKATLAAAICKDLTVHTMVEEELFYPAAREVGATMDEAVIDDLLDEAEHEHAMAKDLIAKIKTMSTGSELDAAMQKLKRAIEHHVEEEETELFPKLKKSGMETAVLGARMMERKGQLKAML